MASFAADRALRRLREFIGEEKAAGNGSFALDIIEQFELLDQLMQDGMVPLDWSEARI